MVSGSYLVASKGIYYTLGQLFTNQENNWKDILNCCLHQPYLFVVTKKIMIFVSLINEL